MQTGIFIRAKIDEKWQSVDIGDQRLPDQEVLYWLRKNRGDNLFVENLVLLLLGREIPRPLPLGTASGSLLTKSFQEW